MIDFDRGSHIEDGALIRLLDGEDEDATTSRQHLESCSTCRNRLDALRDAGSQLDALFAQPKRMAAPQFDPAFLAAIEHTEHTARRRPRRWGAWGMAAAAALAALIVVTSPAGAWIADRISALFATNEQAGLEVPQVPVEPSTRAAAGSEVATLIDGTRLVVRLHESGMPDRLIVDGGSGTMASALVTNAAVPADMLVRPDGFDVMSGAGALEIRIPTTIQSVEVLVDGQVVARWPSDAGAGLPWEYVTK